MVYEGIENYQSGYALSQTRTQAANLRRAIDISPCLILHSRLQVI